jgi:hypothetical protein
MIAVEFYTKLDEYEHFDWPPFVCSTPNIGDYVEGYNYTLRTYTYLQVAEINHCWDGFKPFLKIELHRYLED